MAPSQRGHNDASRKPSAVSRMFSVVPRNNAMSAASKRFTVVSRKVSVFQSLDPDKLEKDSLWRQILCAVIINLVAFLQGSSATSSSVVLPRLQRGHVNLTGMNLTGEANVTIAEESFYITKTEGSWVASTWVLAHLVCAPVAGRISDSIGRKKALILDGLCFLGGFTLVAASQSLAWLIMGRILMGCPMVSQVFLCEVVSPSRRGLAAALYSILHSVGFCMSLLLGAVLPWRVAMAIPAILAIPVIILLILVLHESPAWLFERDRVEEGRQAANFYKLDMEQFRTQQEVKSQRETVRQSYLTCPQPTCFQKFKAKMMGITTMDKSFWANFTFLSLLFLLFGWNGFSLLSFYLVEIFEGCGSPLAPENTAWLTSLTKVVCSVASMYVLHKCPRKCLFLSTGSLICLSFLALGTYLQLIETKQITGDLKDTLNFFPMLMVILAYTGAGLGFRVLPSLLAAETMPIEIRSTVVGIMVTIEMTSTFFLSNLKPMLFSGLGLGGMFLLFSGVVFLIMLLTLIARTNQDTPDDEEAVAGHNPEDEINTEDVDKIETIDSNDPNYENDGADKLADVDTSKQFQPSKSLFKRLAKRKISGK